MHGKIKNGSNTSNLKKKVVEFHQLAEKDYVRLKGYTAGFHQFQKEATKVREVIFFDM